MALSQDPFQHQKLTCGSEAFKHLAPFEPRILSNFELPAHIGQLIAAWDDPEFVGAEFASHMRDDDYVVGIVHKGKERAYPLWITDYYHVINDVFEADPIVFVTCERCQSGAAYVATIDGVQLKFRARGIYNASLVMIGGSKVGDSERSLWLHYEGVAISGKHRGKFLQQIPSFHMTWKEWKSSHLTTEVMLPPQDRRHKDGRHGHGREEYFSRPGMERSFIQTITGYLDRRYAENEMVLGVNVDQGVKAYPLKEVKMAGGVIEDTVGNHPIVVFSGPRPEQFTMAVYSAVVDNRALTFGLEDEAFVDCETGTRWSIEGAALEGPLQGKRLRPVRWNFLRWHSWAYSHPTTDLFEYSERLPAYPKVTTNLDVSLFQPVVDTLVKMGREVVIEGAIVNLQLPHEAEGGIRCRVQGDRLNLYKFKNIGAAEDYVALQGAWSSLPVSSKVGRKPSHRAGLFVLESDPDIQYVDPSQIVRLPDSQISWSDLVTDEHLIRGWRAQFETESRPSEAHFCGLFEHLKLVGYSVVDVAFLPHSQLRVGTVNGIAATINADRFVIYKCESASAADQLLSQLPHAFRVGHLLFRSTPVDMYQDPFYEIGERREEESHWSKLVADERFTETIKNYLDRLGCSIA